MSFYDYSLPQQIIDNLYNASTDVIDTNETENIDDSVNEDIDLNINDEEEITEE